MLVTNVNEHCLLVVIFPAQVGVGSVKYYASPARDSIAKQLQVAQERDPTGGFDLSALNVAETTELFKRR
jgi:hypothetical protein